MRHRDVLRAFGCWLLIGGWATAVAAPWKPHTVRQLNGSAVQFPIPAKLQIVTQQWNRVFAVPYLVYMPEKKRLLMLLAGDYPHRALLMSSNDGGATWTEPRCLHADAHGKPDAGMSTGLTYLGNGKLMVTEAARRWLSNDFGQTWTTVANPPAANGKTWFEWDPLLVDKDAATGRVSRLMSFCSDNLQSDGHFQGYVRFSDDEGITWSGEIKAPEMYAVNEAAFIRARNGDIVAACRTDNPPRFMKQPWLDHYNGLGVSISKDNGRRWSKLNMLYQWGRHHPCMLLLPEGDIVMTYVVRLGYVRSPDGFPQFGVEAVVSRDNGQTWDLDHRYLLHTWVGNRKGSNESQPGPQEWWASSQATSSVLLPDRSLLTAFGTGYRSQPGPDNQPIPRDIGLVLWRPEKRPLNDDRTIRDAPFDSDLRNIVDPATGKHGSATETTGATQEVRVSTTRNGKSQPLAWRSTLGRWQGRDDQLVAVETRQSDLYSGEGARVFLPCTVAGDFDFSCQFNLSDNSNGAGGPIVYFRVQADGSLYAFRYVNYWGTAVLQKKLPGQPWLQFGYTTNVQVAVGKWHDLLLRCRGGEYTVLINGQKAVQGIDAALSGGALGLGCQVRRIGFRNIGVLGRASGIEHWSSRPERPPYVVVCADAGRGGYQAFPGLCRLKPGELLAVFYAGWGHVSRPEKTPSHATGGAVALSRSTDEGKTWSCAEIVLDTPMDDRDPAVWQCDDGTVVISAVGVDWPRFQPPYENWCHTYLVRSADGGKTWTRPEELRITDKGNYTAWTEPRRLANGDWLWPVYLNQNTSLTTAMLRSTDGGRTWGKPRAVDETAHSTDEPDVCQFPDGTLFCAMRPGPEPHMWQSRSRDNGATWTRPALLPFYGHCANLLYTRSGITLLGHRDPGMCIHYSLDQAKTWAGGLMIDPCGGAYSQMVELPDGRVLVVYYTEGEKSQIRAQTLEVTRWGIRALSLEPTSRGVAP